MTALGSTFARRWRPLFTNRPFMVLWSARTLSWFGNAMAPMALGFAVLDAIGGVASLSAVIVARSVPNLLLVLFGGALADRSIRRRVMMWSAFVSAVSQFVCAWVFLSGHATLPLLLALSVVNGSSAALAGPASDALLRLVVPDQQLRDAGAFARFGMDMALLTGTGIGGVLIATFGPATTLMIDAGTFLFAGIMYACLPEPPTTTDSSSGMWRSLREGLTHVLASRWIAGCVLVTWVYMSCFACGIQVLALIVADDTFGRAGLGLANAFQIAGSITGIMVFTLMKDRVRLSTAVAAMGCSLAAPLGVLAFGAANQPPTAGLLMPMSMAMLVAGVIGQVAASVQSVTLQRKVPSDRIGRVGSYSALASLGGIAAGEILAAPLAAGLGVAGGLALLAGLAIAVSVAVALLPSVRIIDSAAD
ncbi:hypothetical protein ALI144C_22720 [Actinosynnema sp. ALI-1.44]|uniref:MFS transporter n=1 Tax=Actinosynnema sp. ALI-1.44 TaxID=1933779 RepID=UPI00097C90FA|nr:MFS transporter [Actinosynnema sp. ALI-1.44]ONI79601.1 hypothetical protein ALI144C_22720 [Actinosynnema sp. ALI-1.44]